MKIDPYLVNEGGMWEMRASATLKMIPETCRSIETMPTVEEFFKIISESGHADFLLTFPGYTGGEKVIPKITRQQVELTYIAMFYLINPEVSPDEAEVKAHSLCWGT
ncbi:hypothetical protein [Reinekea sp. G2M2-21]|uniref:hypothetical protein n=1 Tax=Reinekea sp. G2M2-21 TaxID=2788942 RepID=UPI0018AA945F|nr:hypothetical protein [Reinekea sp. G2M2-21]